MTSVFLVDSALIVQYKLTIQISDSLYHNYVSIQDLCMHVFILFLGKNWPEKFTKLEILKEIPFDPALDCIYSLQYSYSGEVLAVGHGNGAIRVFIKISIYQYHESNAQTLCKYFKLVFPM